MSAALINLLIWVLAPMVIGGVCLFTRRDSGRAILVLSLISLAMGGFDYVVFVLEAYGTIPIIAPSPNYAFIDAVRVICYSIAAYVSVAAVALALYRAAQAKRLGWITGILLVAIISLVSAGIANDPLQFFSRQRYIYLDSLIFAAIGHLAALITLSYALATRRDTALAAPMSMPTPMMYPPMMYPPTCVPPAPYGYPASYAPPPPVVLPAPQPQPPTMTTPS